MERNLTVKAIFIVAALAVLAIAMTPPAEQLNLGIDLRGGTSLLYEVDVPEDQSAEEVMRRTVQVLQDRVDPTGVRNLQWRIEAGNRIEVQMPLPTPEVRERREQYMDLLDQIEQRNIRRGELMAALRAEEADRDQVLQALVRGVDGREAMLDEAADAYDRLQAAREAYEQTEGEDQRIEMAGEVAEAEREFEQVVEQIMATNLNRSEVGRVLELSDAPRRDGEPSHRAQELERLREAHEHRVDEIAALVEAYDAYDAVRGPLDDPNDLIRLLRGAGVLEFRIAVRPDDAPDADELREQFQEQGPRGQTADATRRWFRVDDPSNWADDEDELELLMEEPAAWFENRRGMVATSYDGEIYILLWNTPERSITQRDEGWQLTRASRGQDQRGFPAVNFELNTLGASYMGRLTRNNVNEPMAIVLDGRVYSAPNINDQIRGSGQITGEFSPAELEYLIRTLQAGALQATLSDDPISIRTIGPTLGQDNLERGLRTAIFALIAVAAFMLVYYFFAGLVANVALMANIIIVLGVMSLLEAVFTLPGIAGIVLTIGMCVDANVLIFERIREELNRGADMPTSLRLGYQKALSAIVDGNLTNLIVCFTLGYFATAEVRGFAWTLGIGIVATLLTSVFMSRVIFTAYYRLVGPKKMHMLPTALPGIDRLLTPAVRWVAKRKSYYGVSIGLIVLSLVMIGARGSDMLDIEFRGGTEVSFDLSEGERLALAEVRERLADTPLPDATVVPLGSVDDQFRAASFSVLTTTTDTDSVTRVVQQTFSDVLDIQPTVEFANADAEDFNDAEVYPVDQANLGQVINEPAVEDDISEHADGVAMVLRDLSPSLSIAEIEDRISRMRLQPDYEHVEFRPPSRVVGLQADPENPGRFTDVVVISSDPNIRYSENPETWAQEVAAVEWSLVRDALMRETSLSKVSNFTPAVARTMAQAAIVALVLSILAIIGYIWFRFGSLRYSLAAIAALVHDVVVTLGLVAASAFIFNLSEPLANLFLIDPFKINMAMIAAMLTIIGYSLNDTIVIFDRIRENRGRLAFATPKIINDSINQTISRTVITSGTTFLAVFLLYLFGGEGIHGFAFALVVGVLVGTYSSIAVAASLLLIGTKFRDEPTTEEPAPAEVQKARS